MPPPTTPRSDSPAEDQAQHLAVLKRWGFSRGGLLDNRRGAWWLIGPLRLHRASGDDQRHTAAILPHIPWLDWRA